MIMSCWIRCRTRNVSDKTQNTHFMLNNSPPPSPRKSFGLWDNVGRYSTGRHTTHINIIWRMRFASRITKATDTRAECLIPFAFPLQQCLSERVSAFRYTYIACLVLSATSPETVKSVSCASHPASTSDSLLWDDLLLWQRLFLLLLCTEWPKKMYTLFTHQYLWNKFKWNFYFRVRV